VIGFRTSNTSNGVIATAFGIDANRLATNAHVTRALAAVLGASDGMAFVVQHETGAMLEVGDVWEHPAYDETSVRSPDVGVIAVIGRLTSWLRLASDVTAQELSVLDPISLCGHPGDVSLIIDFAVYEPGDAFRPRATCSRGFITSLRPFDPSVPSTPSNRQLVQHDIPTTGGTSGSPVVDCNGDVIAVHAATTTDAEGANRFAIRVDALKHLVRRIDSGSLAPLEPPAYDWPESLRESCWAMDDAGIGVFVEYYVSILREGLTEVEALDVAFLACASLCGDNELCFVDCFVCNAALVEFVWSPE
jgi:V8-like Glu-specific endopeptidase